MNLLFGLIVAAVPALSIYIIWKYVLADIVAKLPIAERWRPAVGKVLSLFMFIFVFFGTLNTYGPRNELSHVNHSPSPERSEINSAAPFVEPVDRRGQFDRRIVCEPIATMSEECWTGKK